MQRQGQQGKDDVRPGKRPWERQLAAGAKRGKPFSCRDGGVCVVGRQCGLIFREGAEESHRTAKRVVLFSGCFVSEIKG